MHLAVTFCIGGCNAKACCLVIATTKVMLAMPDGREPQVTDASVELPDAYGLTCTILLCGAIVPRALVTSPL